MAVRITTVSVSPESAQALRDIRDEQDLPSMDAAVASLLEEQSIRHH